MVKHSVSATVIMEVSTSQGVRRGIMPVKAQGTAWPVGVFNTEQPRSSHHVVVVRIM